VIDYLQLIKGSKNSQRNDNNREREVSEISRSLKSLAKEPEVPIIALSQLNRSLENRPNKRPLLSDLRESGSIEADADIVAFIYRDEVYHPEIEEKGIAELIVAKFRTGPTDTVKLRWLPQFTLFSDIEHSKVRKLPVTMGAK
jgi:replicative DNA helicase